MAETDQPTSVAGAADLPTLGRDWPPCSPGDPVYRSGCEEFAAQIERFIGGAVVVNQGWYYHVVVVKGAEVYGAFTGSKGLGIGD